MADFSQKTLNNSIIVFDKAIFPLIDFAMFEGRFWRDKQSLTGSVKGRGTTYFFKHNEQEFVLRHYLRGGLIGKIIKDQYLYTGLTHTRAWKELHLLEEMRDLGLPSPTPVAARITKRLGYYQADLITSKIANSTDIHHLLLEKALATRLWFAIGATIAQFHHHQIYHHDLNIHNIMLDEQQKIWLIDFDKCDTRAGNHWKEDNLSRLKRSLQKEHTKHQQYFFDDDDFAALLAGYSA